MRQRCYIAGPLGFTEAGRRYHTEIVLPALAAAVDPVDPWTLTTAAEIARARAEGRERELSLEIGRRNAAAIRSCDVLVAHLDGQEVDSGTAAEVGYAAALGITCLGWRTDLRQAGEPGVRVNLQVESFIVESGGEIAGSLSDLVAALRRWSAAAGVSG